MTRGLKFIAGTVLAWHHRGPILRLLPGKAAPVVVGRLEKGEGWLRPDVAVRA